MEKTRSASQETTEPPNLITIIEQKCLLVGGSRPNASWYIFTVQRYLHCNRPNASWYIVAVQMHLGYIVTVQIHLHCNRRNDS
jgi:hypothetical protein